MAIAREIEPVRARDRPCGVACPARARKTDRALRGDEMAPLPGAQAAAGGHGASAATASAAAASAGVARERYSAGQSLSAVLSAPPSMGSDAGSGWYEWGTSVAGAMYESAYGYAYGGASEDAVPPLAPGVLPEVRREEFEPYLQRYAEVYRRHALASNALAARDSRARTGARQGAQGAGLVACMRAVPELFFAEDFNLGAPGTFAAICPEYSVPGSLVLQERLSHHLDFIEQHLLAEIEARSGSFFDALGALQGLGEAVREGREQATRCRAGQALLAERLCGCAVRVRALQRERENAASALRLLELVGEVAAAADALPMLLQGGDYMGVLDLVEDVQGVVVREQLTGVAALRSLPGKLGDAVAEADKAMTDELVRAATGAAALGAGAWAAGAAAAAAELRAGGHSVPAELSRAAAEEAAAAADKALGAMDFAEASGTGSEDAALQAELLPLVVGLMRSGKLAEALVSLKVAMATETKAAIKSAIAFVLPMLLTTGDEDSAGLDEEPLGSAAETGGEALSLAEKLRALLPARFSALLRAVTATVGVLLWRARTVGAAVEAAYTAAQLRREEEAKQRERAEQLARQQGSAEAEGRSVDGGQEGSGGGAEAGGESSPQSSGAQPDREWSDAREEAKRECAAIAAAVADAAEARWARLLGVRAAEHARLPLASLASLASAAHSFMSKAEAARGRPCYSLRGTVQSQCATWLDTLAANAESKLAALLDAETWVAVATPVELGGIAASLVGSSADGVSTSAGEGNGDGGDANDECGALSRAGDAPSGGGPLNGSNGASNGGEAKFVEVGGVRYHLVRSALAAAQSMRALLDAASAMPQLAPEVPSRIASLMRSFNARSCKLVLGAGALRTAGLKSITAKHLAMASQALTFFLAALQTVSSATRSSLAGPRGTVAVNELERVAGDMTKHRAEIYTKLQTIMRERLEVHARRLPELQAAWAAPTRALPADDEPASAFAGSVIKEVGVLHRVLSPVLTEDEMRAVFGRVATSLSARAAELLKALSTRALGEGVDLDKAAHRTRVAAYAAVDARAVRTSLSALPGAEAACAPLEAFGVRGP